MNQSMDKTAQNMMQMMEETCGMAHSYVDTALKSMSALMKGLDESSKNVGSLIQENLSRCLNAGKTVTEAKSMRDIATMHQDLVKDCVDLCMASATRQSEISARTAKDTVEPMAQHANDTITRVMQKARAAA